ncbi:hypothetical protein [Zarconia navalis]|uniref:hypothetical protein n=1 Tax=Zarconia navalis TaxID=2992134 RepID=UPI0021F8A54F|nr:hypothetical protein [Zarconia navalis]
MADYWDTRSYSGCGSQGEWFGLVAASPNSISPRSFVLHPVASTNDLSGVEK